MREPIASALGQVEVLLENGEPYSTEALDRLNDTLAEIQLAYLQLIGDSLSRLVSGDEGASHAILSRVWDELTPERERIGMLVGTEQPGGNPYLKLVIEYLFTRTRLPEELKMFPAFVMELLERMTLDESIDETIHHLESAMTGKRKLYEQLRATYELLKSGR